MPGMVKPHVNYTVMDPMFGQGTFTWKGGSQAWLKLDSGGQIDFSGVTKNADGTLTAKKGVTPRSKPINGWYGKTTDVNGDGKALVVSTQNGNGSFAIQADIAKGKQISGKLT